jgi:hypothetical protein
MLYCCILTVGYKQRRRSRRRRRRRRRRRQNTINHAAFN